MADEVKPAEVKKQRTVKVGDAVHLVVHRHTPGKRFDRVHVEARVEKVHEQGKFVDLVAPDESGNPKKAIRITESPRDDAGAPDTWHFPETEEK